MNEKAPDDKLQFKPLTPGLGFHPFSDGLPYAPVSKAKTPTTGTGAISAGMPKPVLPKSPAPSLIPQRIAPQVHVPVATPSAPPIKTLTIEPDHDLAPRREQTPPGLGYLFKRLVAFLVDLSIHGVASLSAFYLSALQWDAPVEVFSDPHIVRLAFIGVAAFHWFSTLLQELLFQSTMGKSLFHMRLDGTVMRRFARALLFLPSLLLGGIGVLWALFDPKKRTLYDRWSNVQPREIVIL